MTSESTSAPGGQIGNDNARGRPDGAQGTRPTPPVPAWLLRARADLARDAYTRSVRNWRPDPATGLPGVHGRTIAASADAPDPLRPIRVNLPGRPPLWAATAAEARGLAERDFVQEENAKSTARTLAALAAALSPNTR